METSDSDVQYENAPVAISVTDSGMATEVREVQPSKAPKLIAVTDDEMLSEVSAETIRKAAAVTKIVAVELELSLWETAPLTNGIAQACKELDIPIIA